MASNNDCVLQLRRRFGLLNRDGAKATSCSYDDQTRCFVGAGFSWRAERSLAT